MEFETLLKEPEKKIRSLVRKITHSGEIDLNKEDLKELRDICKFSDDKIILLALKECMKHLHKDQSQVRVSTVKLVDYLFQKSHLIREKLLDNFDLFIELTLAITQKPDVKLKLPPPQKYAKLLQELTAKCIHRWHSEFSKGYEKLHYAYRFLSEHRLVDFNRFQVNTHEQLIRQQRLAERQEKILSLSIENRLKELQELKPEIHQILAQIESLVDILLASGNVGKEEDLTSNEHTELTESNKRQHGVANLSQCIDIQFNPYIVIKKDEANKEVVQNLKELKRQLIHNKLTKLIAIEKVIIKRSDQFVNTLRDIIDLKSKSANLVMKLAEIQIIKDDEIAKKNSSTLDDLNSGSDTDEEFEEVVEKEDIESYIPKSMRYEYGLEPIDPKESDIQSLQLVDLAIPGPSSEPTPSTSSVDIKNGPPITCNVRLESGKLCPRRDKAKCPFHGKIIPRDQYGNPLSEEDRIEEERKAKMSSRVPEWQDPQLLAEIKAATGVDLTMPIKGKKSNKKKANLANTKTCDLTPKKRLQKRLRLLTK